MTDIAIRVDNPCPERSRRMGKRYRIGGPRARYKTLRAGPSPVVRYPSSVGRGVLSSGRPLTADR